MVLDSNAKTIYDVDWTQPSTIIVGNEHDGVSKELQALSTQNLYIPMEGIIESLNVSVATAVTLYEASRQRKQSGQYPNNKIDSKWLENKLNEWLNSCKKKLKQKNFYFSGGVAQNIKAGMYLNHIDNKNVIIPPAAGDTSISIGACFKATHDYCKQKCMLLTLSNVRGH